ASLSEMKRAFVLIGLLVVAAAGAAVARGLQFRGAAKPGVHVLDVDVAGKSGEQIARMLRGWSHHEVTIRAAGRSYHVQRGWLVSIDAAATAKRALDAGSDLALVVPARVDVAPVIRRAGEAGNVLAEIARAGRDPVSATVRLHGATVVVTRAKDGRRLDNTALVRRLSRATAVVNAPFRRVRPAVPDAVAETAASKARRLLAAPVQIDYHGARRGSLSPEQIARGVGIEQHGNAFAVKLDGDALARVVRPRLGHWIQRAHNAQFVVAGGAVTVTPSRAGRDVDPTQLARAITEAA